SPAGTPAAAVPVAPRQVPMPGGARPMLSDPANARSVPTASPSAREATTAEVPSPSPARAVPQPPSAPSSKQNAAEPGQNFPARVVPRPPANSRVVNSTPVFPN